MPEKQMSITKWQYLLILFLEGFASVSFQIITIRQLTEFVGSSTHPVSLTVGLFLGALSLGYYRGGKIIEQDQILREMRRNFLISALLIGIGFSTMFLKTVLGDMGWGSFYESLPYLTAFLLVMMCPAVYLMAKTVPLLSNYVTSSHNGYAAGLSMSISTVGSVAGSILTSILFFLVFGVSATLQIVVVALIILAFLCDRKKLSTYIISSLIFGVTFWLNIIYVNQLVKKETAYNTYEMYAISDFVKDESGDYQEIEGRGLVVNGQFASALLGDEENAAPYIMRAKEIIFDNFGYNDADVLVLGAGGFTMSHKDTTHNRYTYVDIDPEIKNVAEQHFLKTAINGEFIAQDARQFLKQSDKLFDVIFVDLYTHKLSMPWHVSTVEFMKLLKQNVRSTGVVGFNILSNPRFDKKHSKRLMKTIQTAFPFCYIDPDLVRAESNINSLLYVCMPDDKSAGVYVDNIAFDPEY